MFHLSEHRWPGALLPGLILPGLLALVGAGCGQEVDRADLPLARTQEAAPERGGTAVIAWGADPDALNSLIRRSASAGFVLDALQDGLADMGEDLEWHPRIASDWTIDSDRSAITYHLRPWVWADGTPLTARDVVSSFDLFRNPAVGSPRSGQFKDVAAVTALDPATVRYTFVRPQADPVGRSFHAILPAHLTDALDPAGVMNWELNTRPLASGPFVLESWERGRSLSLVPNDLYPPGRPFLDRVVFRIIPDQSGMVVALETGEVDLVDGLTPSDARRLADSDRLRVVSVGGRQYYYLMWNISRPAFADPATRRALSLALDRRRMIDTLLLGYGAPAVGPLAPVMWNFHGDLAADPCDPAEARRLLAAAGWTDPDGDGVLDRDGVRLSFEILTRLGDPVRENGSVILRENLKAVGAEAVVRVLELATGLDLLNEGRFDAYFGSFNANLYGDPSGVVHSRSTGEFNKGHYANAEVDSLLDAALAAPDRASALPLWRRVQELLQADQPSAYLFYPEKLVGYDVRLRGVRPHLLSPINNLDQWWIANSDRKYRSGP